MQKMIFSQNKKINIGILVFLGILIGGVTFYSLGYRINSDFTIAKVGTVSVTIPQSNTSIFIDESKRIVTTKDNELVEIPFSPTKHSIIIARDGFYPWKKDVDVPSGGKITLLPFFIPQSTTGQIITQSDPEYIKIRDEVRANKLPTAEAPVLSDDETASAWVEENGLMFRSGDNSFMVIAPETLIKNVSFYKDRNDVLIFSTANFVYAIDVDKNGGQNFMPIYTGQTPSYVEVDNSSLYILDGIILMQVLI